jgi:acetyltransferase-like isoleucine patch superfamily enzyme
MCSRGELVLGRNCVVAAHSVVTRSAPPYSVLSGNPAMIVRQYDPEKGVWRMGQ